MCGRGGTPARFFLEEGTHRQQEKPPLGVGAGQSAAACASVTALLSLLRGAEQVASHPQSGRVSAPNKHTSERGLC